MSELARAAGVAPSDSGMDGVQSAERLVGGARSMGRRREEHSLFAVEPALVESESASHARSTCSDTRVSASWRVAVGTDAVDLLRQLADTLFEPPAAG